MPHGWSPRTMIIKEGNRAGNKHLPMRTIPGLVHGGQIADYLHDRFITSIVIRCGLPYSSASVLRNRQS
jgi:hypothetical protein